MFELDKARVMQICTSVSSSHTELCECGDPQTMSHIVNLLLNNILDFKGFIGQLNAMVTKALTK